MLAPAGASRRRKLFYLHSWLGFNLALFMTLVLVTGTFAVIADEIDWLIHKELRVEPGQAPVSWEQIEAAIRAYAPTDTLQVLEAGEADYFAYRALMVDVTNKTYYLYVDQWTGEVTGTTNTLTVQRFLRDLHRYLFMPSIIGLPLVTTMAVVLLISLYTGLMTARNWLILATRVRFNKGARVAVGDLHKAIGLWASWFIILIVVTSFWYFAELATAVGGGRFEPSRPGLTENRVTALGKSSHVAHAGQLTNAAMAAFPGLRPTQVLYATTPTMAATVLGRWEDPFVRIRANRVFLDPVDASIITVQKSTEIDWLAYLNELADPFHFGSFGLLWVKLIWFLFGLGLCSLSVTGVYLTWKRVKSAAPTGYQLANLPIVVVTVIFALPYVQRFIVSPLPDHEVALPAQTVENMQLQMMVATDDIGYPTGELRFVASVADGRLNLKEAEIGLAARATDTVRVRPGSIGSNVGFNTVLPNTLQLANSEVEVALSFANGEIIKSHWLLPNVQIAANANSEH